MANLDFNPIEKQQPIHHESRRERDSGSFDDAVLPAEATRRAPEPIPASYLRITSLADGAVGVRIRSHCWNACVKSRLIRVRTFCALVK